MRWFWIDAFVAFESGVRASAIKNVTAAEEHLHDLAPGFPIMPPTLMIEGMAQTAGVLVGEARGFAENVILAKVRRAEFDDYPRPGQQIRYDATIDGIEEMGAFTSGLVFNNGEKIGSVDLVFSHVRPGSGDLPLPEHNFVFTESFLELLKSYRLDQAEGTVRQQGVES
jgi:3-hydroxyacyl-[acyl-carrier-protein] dehydratase